jgi:hypothetical protein
MVTNGDVTVGPVSTTLLVRGVLDGRVWNGFYVRDTRGPAWRAVGEVREVRKLEDELYRRTLRQASPETLESLLRLTDDVNEVLDLGLELAMKKLRAESGVIHCFEDPTKPPVTRAARGEKLGTDRGERLIVSDPMLRVARARCIAVGDPKRIPELRLVATRVDSEPERLQGVAMVPLACSRGVIGMMELGRTDHPFRATDAIVMREVSRKVSSRLELLL